MFLIGNYDAATWGEHETDHFELTELLELSPPEPFLLDGSCLPARPPRVASSALALEADTSNNS